MTRRNVRVIPHDPSGAAAFAAQAATLRSILGPDALAVHHIGSTSVPGLAAKPTIDVLIEARRIEAIDAHNPAMSKNGYEAWGEYGIPGRRFFVKNRGAVRTHNVHVFEAGTAEVERHLAFRDYLLHHPETALSYGRLKEDLAREHPNGMEAYMDGKDAFVKEVEREAISWTRAGNDPKAGPEGKAC